MVAAAAKQHKERFEDSPSRYVQQTRHDALGFLDHDANVVIAGLTGVTLNPPNLKGKFA